VGGRLRAEAWGAGMSRIRFAFGIDLRTLALFRVLVAAMVIADLASRLRDLTAHYSDDGVLPRSALLQMNGSWPMSLHVLSGSAIWQGTLMGLAALVALALLVGYRTRTATVVSWLLLVSLITRNPTLVQGGDNLLAMLLFWGMFLPLGARFSVDTALDRSAVPAPNLHFSAATVALLLQVMSVYFFSALLKSGPSWVSDGTAVAHALNIDHLATPVAVWFRQFEAPMTALTHYVWWLELLGPVLMFVPLVQPWLRLGLQWMFITMHVGFFMSLAIGLFPFVSIASLSAFTPGSVWDWLEAKLQDPKRRGLAMHYDGGCEFCLKTCLLLRTLLLLGPVPVLKAQDTADIHLDMLQHNSWVVVDHDGSRSVRWAAVALVIRRSPVFGFFGRLLGARALAPLGDRIYQFVADHRAALGRVSAVTLPYRTLQVDASRGANLVVAGLAIVVMWSNLASLPSAGIPLPSTLNYFVRSSLLTQKWNMFAPAPSVHEGWFVVRGQTEQGGIVDVLHDRLGDVDFDRPRSLADEFPNYRWRKYLMRLAFDEVPKAHRALYAHYLCRSWEPRAGAQSRLARLQIYFVHEYIQRSEQGVWSRAQELLLIAEHECAQAESAVQGSATR